MSRTLIRKRAWVALAACIGVVAAAVIVALARRSTPAEVGYTELVQIAESRPVAAVHVDRSRVELRLADGASVVGVVADELARHDLVGRFAAAKVPLDFEPGAEGTSILESLAPVLALGVLAGAFFVAHRKRTQGHFDRAESATDTKFRDVAGMDEVKAALEETVELLKDPRRFGRLGGKAPRGVLLSGEPGTGKTLLARAVANEAGVPFLTCAGSSFQEMYVGVGAARVRSLFKEARRLAPCIVFIDEIDAVGRARGKGADSASSERDQTINQLLVEMDGFDPSSGIVVIASTNRPDVLDPAILRPGRFDRQIHVPLPDARGRKAILDVHARPIDLHHEVDLAHVARQTPGFSGAELANLLNEAAILAARSDASAVERDHIERARENVLMGAERKGFVFDTAERHATAVHEAGHVAVGMSAPNADPVHRVSILPRGRALGVTASLPEKDRVMYTKEYLEDQICMLLGGRAAEIAILGTMTAGASDDIERATNIARKMVAELGLSDVGPICLRRDAELPHSEKLLDAVEETTRRILSVQLERARAIVEHRRAEIHDLVAALLERDTLDQTEIQRCFSRDPKAAAG
ncbi:MAG: ATP-dependent zinc metalloprotease FtsH [Polyangiaceae bacterium]